MVLWNVTLDENDHAIMTPAPLYYEEEEPLYLDAWLMELQQQIYEEDQRIRDMESMRD